MLEFLRRLFAREAAMPPELPPAEPPPPPLPLRAARPVVNELVSLQRVLTRLGGRLPVNAAVYLACRLCGLLAGSSEPLGGPRHTDVRFMPSGEVLISTPYPYSRARHLRGSFWHMSAEQITGRPLDARSDVFTLATALYEWIAGGRLFGGNSDFAILEAVRLAHLPLPPSSIPAPLHDVLRKALAREPADRFQSVAEFQRALQPFVGGFEEHDWRKLIGRFIPAAPPLPPEPPAQTPVALDSEGARLVFADWLEEHGKPHEATWVRKESALRSLEGAALEAALLELRELSAKVTTEFMASVARPAVEGCSIRFGFKCPLNWEAMQRTEREGVRHCTGCRQDVHFCRTLEEARELTVHGACVALDPTLVRSEDDLDATVLEGPYLGRMA